MNYNFDSKFNPNFQATTADIVPVSNEANNLAPANPKVDLTSEPDTYIPTKQPSKKTSGLTKILLACGITVAGVATHKTLKLDKIIKTAIKENKIASDIKLSKSEAFFQNCNPLNWFKNSNPLKGEAIGESNKLFNVEGDIVALNGKKSITLKKGEVAPKVENTKVEEPKIETKAPEAPVAKTTTANPVTSSTPTTKTTKTTGTSKKTRTNKKTPANPVPSTTTTTKTNKKTGPSKKATTTSATPTTPVVAVAPVKTSFKAKIQSAWKKLFPPKVEKVAITESTPAVEKSALVNKVEESTVTKKTPVVDKKIEEATVNQTSQKITPKKLGLKTRLELAKADLLDRFKPKAIIIKDTNIKNEMHNISLPEKEILEHSSSTYVVKPSDFKNNTEIKQIPIAEETAVIDKVKETPVVKKTESSPNLASQIDQRLGINESGRSAKESAAVFNQHFKETEMKPQTTTPKKLGLKTTLKLGWANFLDRIAPKAKAIKSNVVESGKTITHDPTLFNQKTVDQYANFSDYTMNSSERIIDVPKNRENAHTREFGKTFTQQNRIYDQNKSTINNAKGFYHGKR